MNTNDPKRYYGADGEQRNAKALLKEAEALRAAGGEATKPTPVEDGLTDLQRATSCTFCPKVPVLMRHARGEKVGVEFLCSDHAAEAEADWLANNREREQRRQFEELKRKGSR